MLRKQKKKDKVQGLRRRLLAMLLTMVLLALGNPSSDVLPEWSLASPETNAIEDHFKYGSIGAEDRTGVPYWIWLVLPQVFPEHLPNRRGEGYARLGFIYESPTQKHPIGTTFQKRGVPRVGLNCATCHTGTVRDSVESAPRIILGMPAQQLDLQGYLRFLTACARDERFTADTILAAIRKENPDFSWFDALLHRLFVIGSTRSAILRQARAASWFDQRPPQGPGRVDTFNPYKVLFGFDMRSDTSVGTADLPSLWNQRPRQGLWLHWDGNNNSVEERNKSAAIGAGASPESLNLEAMKRIEDWILDLKPPAYPGDKVNWGVVENGKSVYESSCASCHAFGGQKVGRVTEIDEIGTDAERLRSFTAALAEKMNTLGTGRPWRFSHFRKTTGYANMPLDGLWLRAPYLHNGSVPNLRALLFPEERPAFFYRGCDVYDWQNVGFMSSGAEAEKSGAGFDTKLGGNSNSGHLYGAGLSRKEKEDLLEYLKTL